MRVIAPYDTYEHTLTSALIDLLVEAIRLTGHMVADHVTFSLECHWHFHVNKTWFEENVQCGTCCGECEHIREETADSESRNALGLGALVDGQAR